jgi:arsenate reductase
MEATQKTKGSSFDSLMIRVLFVCIGNSCRSPMAEGFANYYGKYLLQASSAGSRPAGIIMPETIEVMDEKGIDISHQSSKGLQAVRLDWMDWVIVLEASLGSAIRLPSRRTRQLNWFLTDPIGRPVDVYRTVRDEIELKVLDFIYMIRKEA